VTLLARESAEAAEDEAPANVLPERGERTASTARDAGGASDVDADAVDDDNESVGSSVGFARSVLIRCLAFEAERGETTRGCVVGERGSASDGGAESDVDVDVDVDVDGAVGLATGEAVASFNDGTGCVYSI
jgi:hypothetical protein